MGRPKKAPLSPMQKLAKKIGDDGESVIGELEAASLEELNKRIAQSTQSVATAKEELDGNTDYQQIKSDKKDLEEGFRGVKSRQGAIIKACLEFRKAKGA